FEIRVRAVVVRWGSLPVHEPVLLELPTGRAPPQGARLSVLGILREPRGPSHGFDERAWLRRHGVHVVLRVDAWRRVGGRGGLGGVADRLHAWLTGRQRDAWYALLAAAVALLAWNPYNALDPGFQLSFAAVLSIFLLAPRFRRFVEGYPLPPLLADAVAVSAACGLGTAPVS